MGGGPGSPCLECSGEIPYVRGGKTTTRFCSPKCRYKARDRGKYAADPERYRAQARAYYWANRERVLEKAAARRGRVRAAERLTCEECGGPLEGRRRLVCSERCRDRRYRRLHPVEYAAKQQRKRARRRARAEGAA